MSESLAIKLFPRSWVQIKCNDKVLYIDPSYMKSYYKNSSTVVKYPDLKDDDAELPEPLELADYILYTHSHKDHCKSITTQLLRKNTTQIMGPKGCTKEIKKMTKVLQVGDTHIGSEFKITAVNAYNIAEGRSIRKVHRPGHCLGYIVESMGLRIYHGGDTDLIPEMETLGPIDVAFLPVGGTFTMDMEEAFQAVTLIKPRVFVPMHLLNRESSDLESNFDEVNTELKILRTGEVLEISPRHTLKKE